MMLKQMMMGGLVGLLAVSTIASAAVKPMDNGELAATVLSAPEQQNQPSVTENRSNGQLGSVAAGTIEVRSTPVAGAALPTPDTPGITSVGNNQLSLSLPLSPIVNGQLANIALRNIIIPQSNMR
jgi:hypothetical protein